MGDKLIWKIIEGKYRGTRILNTDDLDIIRRYSRQYEYTVRSNDTDMNDNIAIHSLMSLLQEAASSDAQVLGFGASDFDKSGYCWLLLRASIRLAAKPVWRDDIVIDTWTNGSDKLIALRDFNISGKSGNLFGKATTSWLVADKDTKSPKRITVLGKPEMEIFNHSALGYNAPKINESMLISSSEPVITRTAGYSEIDRNEHVNNTKYITWCIDALGAVKGGFPDICGIDINYSSEVVLGETIDLYHSAFPIESGFDKNAKTADLIVGRHQSKQKTAFTAIVYSKEMV